MKFFTKVFRESQEASTWKFTISFIFILSFFNPVRSLYISDIPHSIVITAQALMIDNIISQDLEQQKKEASIQEIYEWDKDFLQSKLVSVTAYNNTIDQTDDTPNICAWNDRIRPGIIAISRDLEKIGLTRNTEVIVEGIGYFVVLDRMNRRFKNRIDIFMGKEIKEARKFGIKELRIYWRKKC